MGASYTLAAHCRIRCKSAGWSDIDLVRFGTGYLADNGANLQRDLESGNR
mgnify:CR=1 FL=1